MKFAKLFHRIVLRTIREERFLTLLSVLGVALGIGLFMGVTIAANKAVTSFGTNSARFDPAFNYEVAALAGTDFHEDVYQRVRAVARKSLPMTSANAYLPGTNETVEVKGIYTVKALSFLGASARRLPGVEAFFTTPNGVMVSRKFAGSHRLKQGETLDAYVYNNEYRLKIVDIIDSPSAPENTLIMDLGNFQEFFNKTGYLTGIDLSVDASGAETIARRLPNGLTIEKKEKLLQNQKALVASFRYNLRFVTFLAVLVGIFLLYNTVYISVIKRRAELGILRGLGMERKTAVALFTAQGMVLGSAGSLLGIAFGQVFAWFSIAAVEKTLTQFYGSAAVSDVSVTWTDVFSTVALGLAVSFIASFIPALESANVPPNDSSREGTFERSQEGRQKIFSLIGLGFVLAGAVLVTVDFRFVPFTFPWFSYAGILLFILGCTLNAPAYLGLALKMVTRPITACFTAGVRIAVGDTRGSRYRFSLALMSVAVSSALIVATISSVHSFKTSFIDWIDSHITADVYIKPASCASNFCYSPLADEIAKAVERSPGVEAVGRFRALPIGFHDHTIVCGFGNSALLAKYRTSLGPEEKERILRLSRYREVSISDYVKVKYGLKNGDRIVVQTPKGNAAFTINDTSISYSTLSGFLYMDRRWLKEFWGLEDATSLSVYLTKDTSVEQFRQTIEKELGRRYALDITDNGELRRAALRIFDRSFTLTYAIELIAIVISLLGVVNALLILVFERKRELSVLRYLGASWGDIRLVMVTTAGIVGAAGIALGCLMGSVIAVVITHVINKISFGWEVTLRMPFFSLLSLMALLLITTIAAGLIPSFLARRIDPKAYISFE